MLWALLRPGLSICFAPLLAGLALACSGVSSNEQGNLSAEHIGSITLALAPRVTPDRELLRRCGAGSATAAGQAALVRSPFLQQVTDSAATLVFQANTSRPVRVRVTGFDGVELANLEAAPDPNVPGSLQQLVTLSGLQPLHGYCYELVGLTEPAGFYTAPSAGAVAPVRFAVFGDSGSGDSDQTHLRDQLGTVPLDFLLHTGDLAYESGTAAQLAGTVFNVYAALMKSFALFPVAGNHEYATEHAEPYLQAFVLPENGDPDALERYYSFDWGNVHFVGLDTERIDAQQAAWLDADLSQNHLPWKIVFGHRPPFSSGDHGSNGLFRDRFVPVLERHHVQLVLNGHDHDYERTRSLNGITYVVTGGGGVGTRPVGSSDFTAFSESVIHFVYVEIFGDQLTLHAIDGLGREFDQVQLTQSG
jgi:hypothetical protein